MNKRYSRSRKATAIRRALVLGAVAAMTAIAAGEASASCFSTDSKPRLSVGLPRIQLGAMSAAGTASIDPRIGDDSAVVGLWEVSFLVGDGPDVLYQGFQQWHSGGTEVMVDNGVPPSLGNVCVGVWTRTGPRTYKLRHLTFNWDAAGQLTGTFQLRMTVRLDRNGRAFTGSYQSDSFDLSGNTIPELHVKGQLRAKRITVE